MFGIGEKTFQEEVVSSFSFWGCKGAGIFFFLFFRVKKIMIPAIRTMGNQKGMVIIIPIKKFVVMVLKAMKLFDNPLLMRVGADSAATGVNMVTSLMFK